MAKTKEEKRKAWRDYAAKNRAKYLAWSRGWRSTEKGPTFQEFNKRYEAPQGEEELKRAFLSLGPGPKGYRPFSFPASGSAASTA